MKPKGSFQQIGVRVQLSNTHSEKLRGKILCREYKSLRLIIKATELTDNCSVE